MNLHSRRLTIATIVAACTLLLGFALPASAQRPNTQPPIIVTAVGDQVANTLTINGANFFAPATIMLGSIGPLTVTSHTAAQIVATLPPGTPAGSIARFSLTALEISATAIRKLLAAGDSPRYLIPERVLDYIDSHSLYR